MLSQSEQYLITDISGITISTSYAIYRDLEPFHEYDIATIQLIHNDIISIINQIFAFYSKKNDEKCNYDTNKIGLSIDSFISTLEYENHLIQEQINLYVNYVAFYHKLQINYLSKLLSKIDVFQHEINEQLLSNNKINDTEQSFISEPSIEYTIFSIDAYES